MLIIKGIYKMSFRNTIIEHFEALLQESEKKVDTILAKKTKGGATVYELVQAAMQNDYEIAEEEISPKDLLMQFDEHKEISKYLDWVVKQYIGEEFQFGDITQLNDDLKKFSKYSKNKNVFENPDLGRIATYAQLKTKLDEIDDNDMSLLGSSQKKNAIKTSGSKDVDIFADDKDFLIVIPKTKAASIYWGRGTRWCTAADNGYFEYYTNQGPLYILINKKDKTEKYQFHLESGSFMDKNDNAICLPLFLDRYKNIREMFRKAVFGITDLPSYELKAWREKYPLSDEKIVDLVKKSDASQCKHISPKRFTEELCAELFTTNGETLDYIPKNIKNNKSFWEKSIMKNGMVLRYMGEDIIQKYGKKGEAYYDAVKSKGEALQYVPRNKISYNMCKKAVVSSEKALQHVPDEFKTEEICHLSLMKALSNYYNGDIPNVVKFLPDEFKTEELCNLLLMKNGNVLQYVPEKLKTPEICLTAIENKENAFNYTPQKLQNNKSFIVAAFQKNPGIIKHLPRNKITFEMCKKAVWENYRNIEYVPKNILNEELCVMAAIHHGIDGFIKVPEELRTTSVCRALANHYSMNGYPFPSFVKEQLPDHIKQEFGII